VVLVAGFVVLNYWRVPDCMSDSILVDRELAQSNANVRAVADANATAKCATYRKHLELLEATASLAQRCRPREGFGPLAELESFRHLVAQ
jgi:hypothetical protein